MGSVFSRRVARTRWGLALSLLGLSSCGTEARGIAECRALESARCDAVALCGYPDVFACKRFVREHCLHGLLSDLPEPLQLTACLQAIEAAGACLQQNGAEAVSAECGPPLEVEGPSRPVCDVLRRPENLTACVRFGIPPSEPPPAPEAPSSPGTPDAG